MATKKTSSKKTSSKKTKKKEKIKVAGYEMIKKIKELIKEGNVRRIKIKDENDDVIMEIPVTVAVVGTVFAPMLAAVGALAALLSKATLEVERKK
ncbi:MAG: DUF4342 domain-containing protein [Patescibacteria group bacterium]|jgi:hypothetical protein|nr:DUF4342 domain-containing protein [Patescibacteria group bacterium]MDD4443506.1 DUF4342 domain-containing protein [Patescibacteria group bacterium]